MKWRKLSSGWARDDGPQYVAEDGKGRKWFVTATRRRVGRGQSRRYDVTYRMAATFDGEVVWRNEAPSLADAKRQIVALWN